MKFNDSDGNGIREPNEMGLPNRTIDLNYTNGAMFKTTTTDMNGNERTLHVNLPFLSS